jgi:hypothetical protein
MGMNCRPRCWKMGLLVLVGIAAMGYLVMVLWNWLLPALFAGVRQIGYLQALGVLLLSKILFGGFRGCHGRWHHRHRFAQMTPEEREKFQIGMRGCCGNSKQEAEEI